jgi:hypothetical protein
MANRIDLSFRPDSYWPESRTPEQLLARIKGRVRRELARRILAEDGFAGLTAFLAREELPDEERRLWGLQHPSCFGGEYLPSVAAEAVEIARISLASVLDDVISVRAIRKPTRITYAVVDEYETKFTPPIQWSKAPLTLGQLIEVIDETVDPDGDYNHGLVWTFWLRQLEYTDDIRQAIGFVDVESAFYPQLTAYYRQEAAAWQAEHVVADTLHRLRSG